MIRGDSLGVDVWISIYVIESLNEQLLLLRADPRGWFQAFGRYLDEETRKPTLGWANVLQRRVFEHYRRCQEIRKPCRMVVLKYRRAGSSTAGACLTYLHAMNYHARLGVIGTDYKASSNMMEMVHTYAANDDFPGWRVNVKETGHADITPAEWDGGGGDQIKRKIATKLEFSHDSVIELYTSRNPESARSAGLSGYHATECGRWQSGGEQDAGETLTAMRNTLPKRGFHLALEESTANGAQGVFYETCRTARWPDYAEWPRQWQSQWPLAESEFGRDLQFVFIFAAWFEDARHLPEAPLTPREEARIRETLDEDERALIARFGQEGPRGPRLGAEVEATVWEQLAWRRAIIATVCTKGGADEFKQEYPSTPAEAFRASGSPALDREGLSALEIMAREAAPPEPGGLENGRWRRSSPGQAPWQVWEHPRPGGKYLVACDPMTGAEAVHGTGEKDRHAVFVLRDAYVDAAGAYHRLKAVARLRPPCQWEDEMLVEALDAVSRYYGGATIAVEANVGAAILKSLHADYNAPLFRREEIDKTTQAVTTRLGWWTDTGSRRVAISALQTAVREQSIELLCPHAVAELNGLVIDNKGKAVAGGSGHDDDAMALAIGLATIHTAAAFIPKVEKRITKAPDEHLWKEA